MHLGAFFYPTGYHLGAWRHPQVPADAGSRISEYIQFAIASENAGFDFMFLADGLGFKGDDLETLSRTALRYVAQLEPITALSAVAVHTRHLGLVASASSTYNAPYTLARQFASLDLISDGRAGWNLVTGQNRHEAPNYGRTNHPDHETRYARAREFTEAVLKLWSSWDAHAFTRNKLSGQYFDPDKMHEANYHGAHLAVKGPLNVPPSRQNRPLLVQSGSSELGRDLAGTFADVTFTAQRNLDSAIEFRSDIRSRATAKGRNPDDIQVLVGVVPYVGKTIDDAARFKSVLNAFVEPRVALSMLSTELGGVDFSNYGLSDPLPRLAESDMGRSRGALLREQAYSKNLSIGELAAEVVATRGHLGLTGTGAQVAETMLGWHEAGACDGFIVMFPALPIGLETFNDHVMPHLRDGGAPELYSTNGTLRERFSRRPPL